MLVVWIVLGILAGLLAVLAVPVELIFAVRRHAGQQETRATLRWLFGLVRVRLGKPEARSLARPERPGRRRTRRKRGGARRVMAMLRMEGFGRRLLRLARDLLRRIRIRELSLAVRLGLDDPADTGRLWGVVGPLAALLARCPVARIAIEPDFGAEALDVDGKGHIRIVPIELLFVMLVFVLNPATLRALYAARAAAR